MKKIVLLLIVALPLLSFSCAPAPPKQPVGDTKKRIDEINVEIAKLQDTIKQYDDQIAQIQKEMQDMTEQVGPDDPAAQELGESLKITQSAQDDAKEKLQDLQKEKAALEGGAPAHP